jgi:hypothetical protein
MNLRSTLAALLMGMALAAGPAAAHEPTKGPNGGLQVDAGTWHAELVANGTPTVTIHLADADGKAIPAVGFKANAIFVIDGNPQRFTLEAADGSKLVGTAPVGVPAGVKGAVQLTAPDGKTGQAKF